jgi:acetyltransferase-like isoleucine patch superfamily enzyme
MTTVGQETAYLTTRRPLWITRIARLALPDLFIEMVSRFAGYIGDIFYFDKGLSVEAIIRARLLNLKYGFQAKDIGRGVVLGGPERIIVDTGVCIHHGVVIMTGTSGYCHVGARSHVSHGTVLAAGGGLDIGSDCALSSGIAIYTATNQRQDGLELAHTPICVAPVRIGPGVLIGANAVVLPGVSVGEGAVIGAGAVVRNDVSPQTIVAGVPARPLRTIKGC